MQNIVKKVSDLSDREIIQNAIDCAFEDDTKNVIIPEGEWEIDAPLFIRGGVNLVLDGAVLKYTGEGDYCIKNSNILKERLRVKYGREYAITITGQNGAKIKNAGMYLLNTGDFYISGICFENSQYGITVLYSNHGRISDIILNNCVFGIEILTGTRNCFVWNISGQCEKNIVRFSQEKRNEIVYYNGPDVHSHIARNIKGNCTESSVSISGEKCFDIIVNDVCSDNIAVSITDAYDITVRDCVGKVIDKSDESKRNFIK